MRRFNLKKTLKFGIILKKFIKAEKMGKIKKVLIANRGEIALRIIRACKELEIGSVAIFSEVDVEGIWVRKADECYPIMGDVVQAYLDYEKIISIAKKSESLMGR